MIKVVCGVIYKEGRIFIARKKEGKPLAGFWEFPGGKIEQNESPEQALQRELQEELGMRVEIQSCLGAHLHQYPTKLIKLVAYTCLFIDATLELTDHDQFEWVLSEELIHYQLAAADIPFIDLINGETS